MKKLLIIFLFIFNMPVFALDVIAESLGNISDFQNTLFQARVLKRAEFKSGLALNLNDEIEGVIIKSVEAKRGKREGYIIIHPTVIYREGIEIPFDYKNMEAKVLSFSKAELEKAEEKARLDASLTIGGHYIPGLSHIFYFFKGLATPSQNQTRIQSGMKSLYENSPLSYIEKGKEMDIKEGDYIMLKFYNTDVPLWKYNERTK